MDTFQILTIISCVMSTITAVAVCTAILPHIKKGMVVVRDAVLSAAFVLLIAGFCWMFFTQSDSTASNSRTETTPSKILKPILEGMSQDLYAGK